MLNISVIIPTKNRGHTLPYCLDSILSQIFPAKEIIVGDEGWVDDTEAVVLQYKKYNVHYVKLLKGTGAQAARNYGVLLAKYDWISFQDSDDKWFPEKLSEQVSVLEKNKFASNIIIHSSGIATDKVTGKKSFIVKEKFHGMCYEKLLIQPGPMYQSMLVHKSAILNMGMLDEKCPSFQEWDTSIRLAKNNIFYHIDKPLFEWVFHNTETISKDFSRDIYGHLYVLNKHKNEILTYHGKSTFNALKSDVLSKAIKHDLYYEQQLLLKDFPFLTRFLATFFIRTKFFPRGANRLMRMFAKINF